MKARMIAHNRLLIECPACDMPHVVGTASPGPIWSFNGDLEKPTLSPSILAQWDEGEVKKVCHSFVKDGMIQYLNDCTHELAGQTVELGDV